MFLKSSKVFFCSGEGCVCVLCVCFVVERVVWVLWVCTDVYRCAFPCSSGSGGPMLGVPPSLTTFFE